MKRHFSITLTTLFILLIVAVSPALANGGNYTVRAGDTLANIAARYGLSIQALAQANGIGWNSWVYTGQQLTIPGENNTRQQTSVANTANNTSSSGSYTVKAGDTLNGIAYKHGITVSALQSANSLSNANYIYTGQRLSIPGGSGQQAVSATTAPATSSYGASGEKWIDINLSAQTVTAYQGQTPIFERYVSTGTWNYPTVAGTFSIYHKTPMQRMFGGSGADYYDIPDVPHVMYFYEGYGFHGAYWHNNFGTPMSHGCVNLSLDDAAWLYNWAEVGTKVVSHY